MQSADILHDVSQLDEIDSEESTKLEKCIRLSLPTTMMMVFTVDVFDDFVFDVVHLSPQTTMFCPRR